MVIRMIGGVKIGNFILEHTLDCSQDYNLDNSQDYRLYYSRDCSQDYT